jgi:hypothetical protein
MTPNLLGFFILQVTDAGSLNLLSRSCAEYNINELGLQKRSSITANDLDGDGQREKTYQCASHEMCVFGAIGWGASSIVRKAIHIPSHRILALKKINVFEKVVIWQYAQLLFNLHQCSNTVCFFLF